MASSAAGERSPDLARARPSDGCSERSPLAPGPEDDRRLVQGDAPLGRGLQVDALVKEPAVGHIGSGRDSGPEVPVPRRLAFLGVRAHVDLERAARPNATSLGDDLLLGSFVDCRPSRTAVRSIARLTNGSRARLALVRRRSRLTECGTTYNSRQSSFQYDNNAHRADVLPQSLVRQWADSA